MDAIDCIKSRKSIRSYSNKSIQKDILQDIVNYGRLAATARNIQPWEFVVIREKNTLRKLSDICDSGPFLKEAEAAIIVICKNTKYYLEDGCAAVQNILLGANAHGVGSCWIAGNKKPYAKEILSIVNGTNLKLIAIISLGYPASETTAKPKRELSEVMHWEKL